MFFTEFDRVLPTCNLEAGVADHVSLYGTLVPQMKDIVRHTMDAVRDTMALPEGSSYGAFQVGG